VLDPFGPDKSVGNRPYLVRSSSYDQNFKTVVNVEMDVIGADDGVMIVVLKMIQTVGQVMGVVTVNQGDRAYHFPVSLLRQFLDQTIPHEIAQCLGPVGITLSLNLAIKPGQQGCVHRHTEANQLTADG